MHLNMLSLHLDVLYLFSFASPFQHTVVWFGLVPSALARAMGAAELAEELKSV